MSPSTEVEDGPSVREHRAIAERVLHPAAAAYFFGGAECESALHNNVRAFAETALVPRVLRDVSEVNTSVSLGAIDASLPVLIAPMALQTAAHKEGEAAVARAARACGFPMALSMFSGTAVETVQPALQQIYMLRSRKLTLHVAERAKAAGAQALVLTVDAPRLGRRLRDERAPRMPPHIRPVMLAELLADAGGGGGGGGAEAEADGTTGGRIQDGTALATLCDSMLDASLTPDAIGWLARESGLPVCVKGVLHADDARACVDAGAAAIVVSNHGGRQVGSAVAPLRVLEAVVRAVDGRVPVLVDSGVRRPEDVVKALALGARAVLLGRPVLEALAADGERGVRRLLREFAAGVRLAFTLCGAAKVDDIRRDMVVTPGERDF